MNNRTLSWLIRMGVRLLVDIYQRMENDNATSVYIIQKKHRVILCKL